MDVVIADPPLHQMSEAYAVCEWATRLLPQLHTSTSGYAMMNEQHLLRAADRVAKLAMYTFTPAAKAVMWAVNDLEVAVLDAETQDGMVRVPIEAVINLANRVLEYARH